MKTTAHGSFALALGVATLGITLSSGAAEVKLDAPTQQRIGITTRAVQGVQHRAEAEGLGQVMGLDALAQTDAELTGAEAAVRSSDAALARARGLYEADTSVSRQVLEGAERQATTDSVQLALARRKSIAIWGRDAPWVRAAQRTALLAKISAGTSAIVRATFPADTASGSGGALRVEALDGTSDHHSWTATSAWAAPADPAIPGRSYYLLINDAQDLTPGQRVRVFLSVGPGQPGVVVPAAALIIAGGDTWLYVEEKSGAFVRRAVALSAPVGDGYFTAAVHPGERVVVQGAGALLAREAGTGSGD